MTLKVFWQGNETLCKINNRNLITSEGGEEMKKSFNILLLCFVIMFSFNSCALNSALKATDEATEAAFEKYDSIKVVYKQIRKYAIDNKEILNLPDDFWEILEDADKQLQELDEMVMSIIDIKEATVDQVKALESAGKIVMKIVDIIL